MIRLRPLANRRKRARRRIVQARGVAEAARAEARAAGRIRRDVENDITHSHPSIASLNTLDEILNGQQWQNVLL